MRQIEVAVIGTGWCGGIRARALAGHPLVSALHVAEILPDRLEEIARATGAKTATEDWHAISRHPDIKAVYISATPEDTHFPMARECLAAGKHVFLEKPIAMALSEADELIKIAHEKKLKFTIGYSQRFNPKYASSLPLQSCSLSCLGGRRGRNTAGSWTTSAIGRAMPCSSSRTRSSHSAPANTTLQSECSST